MLTIMSQPSQPVLEPVQWPMLHITDMMLHIKRHLMQCNWHLTAPCVAVTQQACTLAAPCLNSLRMRHHQPAWEAALAETTMQQVSPHDFLMVARSCALTSFSVNKQVELSKLLRVGAE